MSQNQKPKVEVELYKGKSDERGHADMLLEIDSEHQKKISIPYCSKVKETFNKQFLADKNIYWFTHSLQINETKLWYDDEIYKYKDLLKDRKTVVKIVPDEEEPCISIFAYYIGVGLEKILLKLFPNHKQKTD